MVDPFANRRVNQLATTVSHSHFAPIRPTHLIAAAALILFGAYGATWMSLLPIWSAYFSHGFVVVAFTAWMIFTEGDRFARAGDAWYVGLVPLLVLSLLWMLMIAAQVQILHQVLAVAVVATWLLTVAGLAMWPTVLRICAVFSLALPIWMLAIPVLQSLTVGANIILLRLWRLNATVRDNFITIPNGTFEVAQSCAGEAFFMSGLTIATVYLVYLRPSRHAAVALMGLAVGLSIVSNWIRVFGLILVGHYAGMAHPLIVDHGWYGWVIFAVVQLVFFWQAPRIERHWPANAMFCEATPEPPAQPKLWRRVVLATAIGITGPVLLFLLGSIPSDPVPHAPPGIAQTPTISANAQATWHPEVEGAGEHRVYALHQNGLPVQVDRFVFTRQSQGREMVNEMNRLVPDSLVLDQRVIGPLDASLRQVHQLAVRDAQHARIAWFWYQVAGRNTVSGARAKLLETVAFVTRSAPSELVVVSAPCANPGCRDAVEAVSMTVTGQRPR